MGTLKKLAGTVTLGASVALGLVGIAAASEIELKEGDAAPAFKALGDDGKTYALADLAGKYVIVYFYPKDDTTGCTIEAKGFRDDATKYVEKGAVVLGVSSDDAASHKAFREKYQLNFPLLVDGKPLAAQFGVPTTFGYASRQTFVIGKDGKVLKVFRNVDPKVHSAEILALLK
jgi:peroxiredoxin Q/BCP